MVNIKIENIETKRVYNLYPESLNVQIGGFLKKFGSKHRTETGDYHYKFGDTILAIGWTTSLTANGLKDGSVISMVKGKNPNTGYGIGQGKRKHLKIEFNSFSEIKKYMHPVLDRFITPHPRFTNYLIVRRDPEFRVDWPADKKFEMIDHVGTTQRDVVYGRFLANVKKYDVTKYGMVVLFDWSDKQARKLGFNSAEEICYGFELKISEFDECFAHSQSPGTPFKSFNDFVLNKIDRVNDVDETIYNRILKALSPPVFVAPPTH
jgi:hypothetical protein